MELRRHPLMSYQGLSNWPPLWLWRGGVEDERPEGEVGILTDVMLSTVEPFNGVFLVIEYEGSEYTGRLLFDDRTFCCRISQLLKNCYGYSIRDIGGLDVSHTL